MIEFYYENNFFVVVIDNVKNVSEIELLFLSRYIPYSCRSYPSQWIFFIPKKYSKKVQKEIRLFLRENRKYPLLFDNRSGEVFQFYSIHWVVVLFLVYFHRTIDLSHSFARWIEAGSSSAREVLSGEYLRIFTALTLHGDYVHLLSNSVALWLFACLLSQYLGSGQAWLFVLFSGGIGNLLNVFFYQTGHHSIGASTAVFGAVGIMGGLQLKKSLYRGDSWQNRFLPIAGSFGLLAMLGVSPRSDLMAHLFGLLSGIVLGLGCMYLGVEKVSKNKIVQIITFGIFCGILFLSWKVQL